MSTVRKSVEIDVPVKVGCNQWTQFQSFPQFMDGVESITQTDDAHGQWVAKVGGVTREYDTEIVRQTPDTLMSWRGTGGDTGGHSGQVSFDSLRETATRVTIELSWEPEGLVKKAYDLQGVAPRQVDRSAAESKRFIESRGTATGEWHGGVEGGTATPQFFGGFDVAG